MERMAIRALVVVPVLAAQLLTVAPVANAHRADSFTACRWSSGLDECQKSKIYMGGDRVVIKGVVKPSHRNYQAEVWRRLPNSGGVWRQIKAVDISKHGEMFFRWHTDESDVNNEASYGFQFRIPGHGRSNKVRVWVVSDI